MRLEQIRKVFGAGVLEKLTTDSIFSLMIKVVAMLLSFATIVLINKIVEPSEYGTYVYALSLVSLLKILSVFGGDLWLIREVASRTIDKFNREVDRLRDTTMLLTVTVSILFSILLYMATHFTPSLFNNTAIDAIKLACLLIPFLTAIAIFQAYFRGLHKAVFAQVPDAIVRPVLVIMFLPILAYVIKSEISGTDVMGLHLLATLLVIVVFIVKSPVRTPHSDLRSGIGKVFSYQEFFLAGISLVFIAFVNQGNMFIVNILLGNLATIDDVALFSVSNRISDFVTFMQTAIVMPLAPAIARALKNDNQTEMLRLAVAASWGGFLFALPVSVCLISFPEVILGIFGEHYSSSPAALRLMVAVQLLTVALGPVNAWLVMTKNEKSAIKSSTLGLLVLILVALITIPRYGAFGGAISFSSGLLVTQLLMLGFVVSKVGINPSIGGLRLLISHDK